MDSAMVMQEREQARPSLIPSLCTHFTRVGIEWRRSKHGAAMQRAAPLGPGMRLSLPCGWDNAGRMLACDHDGVRLGCYIQGGGLVVY